MMAKKITAIICSLGMLLSSVSVSGASAVTSTEKGTFFNVKTDESGRYHFEYRFDENGRKKGNDITHAAYIISTKEDISSLKTDDTLLYSLEEIKNNSLKWYNDDHDFSDKNYDDSRFSPWKNITEYSIDEILKKYDSDYTDNLDNIYVYRSNPYLTASERKEEAENISKKYSADYIIDMDFNQNTWAENGAKRILFELKDGIELTDELKKEILSKAGTEINKVDLEAEAKKDSVLDSRNYCINFFGNYINKDNIYGFEVSSEDDKSAAETAEKLYDLEEVKSAFPDFYATMGRQVYYNVTLLYPNEKTLADNEELEEVPNTEDTAPATETTEPVTETSKEDTTDPTETETTATEETKITDLREIFDMLGNYLDEKYDVPSILRIEENCVSLRFRYGAFKNDNEFEKADEDIKNFLKEKNVDISLILITYENVSPEPTTDGTKITDLDEICNILKPYMDEHYKDYIDNQWQLHVRNEVYNVHIGFGRDVFKDDDAKMQEARKDIMNFLEEKNVDTSLVLITFDVLSSGETTDPTETTDKIELPTQEITNEPTKETTTEPKETKVGDINGDDTIDSKDAVLVLKSYAESLANNKTYYEKAADVNNDGKVDSKDAVEILKTYAKNLVGNKN